jgi:large subunit ribosomal protein L16
MLMPKRIKGNRRKMHRGRMTGRATRGNTIAFGEYAIISQDPQWVTSRQIEAARIAMTRHIKRGGKIWIRIFPDKSYTKKPLETRMGKGKAGIEGWVAVVKPGRVLFEMAGPPVELAKEAMRLAIFKLPMRCKFVTKAEMEKLGLVSPSHAMNAKTIIKQDTEVEVETTEGVDEPTETVNEVVGAGEEA